MREIDWRLRAISSRRNLQSKFDASLHGMEIKIPNIDREDLKPLKISEEHESAIQKAFEARMQNGRR